MARGRNDAPAMGREIAERGYIPSLVLSSDSARTTETLELVRPFLQPAPEEHLERRLYLAEADTILRRAAELSDDVTSVLFIGHNPGLEEVALRLADRSRFMARIGEKFPTAAFAAFETTHATWRDAVVSPWTTLDVIYPSDL